MLKKDAGAWHIKTDIDLALLLRPLVMVAMLQGKATDTIPLKRVPKALVGLLSQQGKVELAAVELRLLSDVPQLVVQELLHLGRKHTLGFVHRRIQNQRPPFRRAWTYCRSMRYSRARLIPSISHAWACSRSHAD